jgi:acyl-CoA dehydrogenase
LKFLNYLFAPTEQPPVPSRQDPVDDEFLFRQGPARGLGKVTFADWRLAFEPFGGLPNVFNAASKVACPVCSTSCARTG